MADDGSIELDLDIVDDGAAAGLDTLLNRTQAAIQGVQQLRTEFLGAARAAREAADAMRGVVPSPGRTFQNMREQARNESGADAYAQSRIATTRVRDGRTIREARIANSVVGGLITGINTEVDQLAARLRVAATMATRRLILSTEQAMAAELNAAAVSTQIRQARYGTSEAANLRLRAAVISDGRLSARLGNAQTYDDVVRQEAAASLARQRQQAMAKQVADQAAAQSSLDRQRQQAMARQLADEQRAQERLNTPRTRIRDEANTARDAAIGGMSLAEVRAMDAQRVAAQRAQAQQARQQSRFGGGLQNSLIGMIGTGIAIGGVAEMVHSIVDLDDAMTKFQAITKSSDSVTADFKARLLDLAAGSRYATTDLVEAATTLGQTGLAAKEVAEVLPSVITLATSAGTSLHQSVEVLTSVLGAYNMESSRTGDLATIMSGALTKTRLTIEQLSVGLQYSADIASQTGISITELTAVMGGLAQAGARSGSVMGTQVRQLIREFENPTAKFKAEMQSLGITMADIDVRSNGLMGVMDNLRAHGFGMAEAIQSFQARTITGFAALMIQGNNIKRLQTELLLYTGATEGADRANSSLIARVTQLGNSLLAFSDAALAPAVEGLKATTGGLASVFEAAVRLGPVLPALGAGLLGVATAFAVFKGLQLGQMLFFSITQAAMGLVGALTGAEGAAIGLSAAFGPIGLAVGVLTAVAAGVAYFVSNMDRASDRIDKIKGNIQDLDSRIKQANTTEYQINKMIDDVGAKRDKLNDDPLLRRNAIIEAQKQFEDMGLAVKANATNIDDLIDALRRLRGELSQNIPAMIAERLSETAKMTTELQRQLPEQNRQRASQLGAAFGVSTGVGRTNQRMDAARVATAVSAQLGPEFGPIAAMAMDSSSISQTDARGSTSGQFRTLSARLNTLLNEHSSGQTSDQQGDIGTQIDQISTLISALTAAVDQVSNIQSNLMASDRLKNEGQVAEMVASPAHQKTTDDIHSLSTSLEASIAQIRNNSSLSPQAEDAQLQALKLSAQTQLNRIRAFVKAQMAELEKSGKRIDAVTEAWQPLLDSTTSLTALVTDADKSIEVTQNKLHDADRARQKKALDDHIKNLDEQLRSPNTPSDQLDDLQKQYNTAVDQQAQLAKSQSNVKYGRYLSTLPSASVPGQIATAATSAGQEGMAPFLVQLGMRESSLNPSAGVGGKSAHQGLFQISPSLASGANLGDVQTQVQLALKKLSDDESAFTKTMGRAPTDQERYLMWQQGASGATSLLQNPNALALDSLTRSYGGNRTRARQAITSNYPGADVNTLTSADFASHVKGYFGSTPTSASLDDDPNHTWLTEQSQAEEDAATKKKETGGQVAARKYRDAKASDTTGERSTDERITVLQALAENKFDSIVDSTQALTQAGQLQLSRISKAVSLYDQDPSNKDKTPGETDSDRQEIISTATDKYSKLIISAAQTISTKGSADDKATLARLEAEQKAQQEHPERYSQAAVSATDQEAAATRKRVASDPVAAQQAAVDFLEAATAKLKAAPNFDPTGVTALQTETDVQKKKLTGLRATQAQQQSIDRNEAGSIPNAVLGGTSDFVGSLSDVYTSADKSPSGVGSMKTLSQQLPSLWDQTLSAMDSSTSRFFANFADGTVKGSMLFQQFARSMLNNISELAAKSLTDNIFGALLAPATKGGASGGGGILTSLFSAIFTPSATGGLVRLAGGGGVSTRDSVPALLQPGEYVMRASAVDAIGRDQLDAFNNMGASRLSRSAPAAAKPINITQAGDLNVWAVAPNAQPPPSPSDIVHIISNDMQQGGQTKTLIKSIAAGQM